MGGRLVSGTASARGVALLPTASCFFHASRSFSIDLMNDVRMFTRSSISWRFSGLRRTDPPSSMFLIRFFSSLGCVDTSTQSQAISQGFQTAQANAQARFSGCLHGTLQTAARLKYLVPSCHLASHVFRATLQRTLHCLDVVLGVCQQSLGFLDRVFQQAPLGELLCHQLKVCAARQGTVGGSASGGTSDSAAQDMRQPRQIAAQPTRQLARLQLFLPFWQRLVWLFLRRWGSSIHVAHTLDVCTDHVAHPSHTRGTAALSSAPGSNRGKQGRCVPSCRPAVPKALTTSHATRYSRASASEVSWHCSTRT